MLSAVMYFVLYIFDVIVFWLRNL